MPGDVRGYLHHGVLPPTGDCYCDEAPYHPGTRHWHLRNASTPDDGHGPIIEGSFQLIWLDDHTAAWVTPSTDASDFEQVDGQWRFKVPS